MQTNRLGGLWDDETKHQAGSIYDINGLAPTIDTMTGGGREPHILEVKKLEELKQLGGLEEGSSQRIINDDYNGNITQDQDTIGTITQTCGNDALRNGKKIIVSSKIVAIDEQNMLVRSETIGTLTTDGNSPKHNNRVAECEKLGNIGDIVTQGRSVYSKDGIAPSLIAGMSHGNTVPYVTEEKTIKIRQATEQGYALCEIGGAVDLGYPTSKTRRGRVIENGKICPTLTTENIPNKIELGNPKFFNFLYEIEGELWFIRIRKLTPKECWRLMGFYDEDFEKAAKVCSNTQLYKQAGNSIVVDVLEAIFGQLLKGEENELHNSG